jgi:hypothetical protein
VAHVANITIAAAQVSADLTDYVVYVDLSDLPTAEFWGTVANGGGDIRCFKSDGTTELAREVVSCDTSTDTGELWIKYSGTLSSSVDTVIQIHADGTSADYAATATYGRNAVWSDYTHVYHLNANSATDSAGNGDLTLAFTSEAATGKFGENATQFDGGADAKTPSIAANTTGYYLSAWAKVDSVGGPSNKDVNIATNSQIKVWADAYSGSASRFAHADLSPTSIAYGSDVNEGAWQFFGGLFNGTNGFSAGNGSLSSGASMNGIGAGAMDIGNSSNAADMCEWRYRPTSVSADWISTEYTNQNTPNTFYTAAAPSTGGVTVTANQASETDAAQAVSPSFGSLSVSVGQSTETGTAQSISPSFGAVSYTIGQASETDSVQAIAPSLGALSVSIGQASETDTSQDVTPDIAIGAYSDEVLALNPWLYWKVDEASGALVDSSGNGNNSVAQSITTYQDTNILNEAGAAEFNGTSDYAKDTAATGYVADGVMSVVIPMRYNDTLPASGTIFHVGDFGNGSNRGFRIYFTGGNTVLQGWASSNYRTVTLNWQPTIGANSHVVFVLTTTSLKVYEDGVEAASTAHSWTYNNNTTSPPVTLGSAQSTGESDFTQADFGHFALFNQALTPAEITRLYSAATAASEQTVAVGQVTETDAPQSVSSSFGSLTKQLGISSESDVAQAITATFSSPAQSISVGQATEIDTTQTVTTGFGSLSIQIGQPTETDTSQAIALSLGIGSQIISVGQVTETDTTQGISPSLGSLSVQIGQATETDTAQDVTQSGASFPQTISFGFAAEVDTARNLFAAGFTTSVIKMPVNYRIGAQPGEFWLEFGEYGFNYMYSIDEDYNRTKLGQLYDASDLPKEDPNVVGEFWNDDGTLKVSNG